MAKPELGTKRLCPNCGAKYYDLDRDPITCPKCDALFLTGAVAVTPDTASDDEDTATEEEGVELVPLETADADADDDDDDDPVVLSDEDDGVSVATDDDALIDDDDEVSDVVRAADDGEEEDR